MWDRSLHRIALLELAVTAKLHRRQDQEEAWNELLNLRWARRTGRQHELALADEHRVEYHAAACIAAIGAKSSDQISSFAEACPPSRARV